jgi:hypothetical protein
VRSEINIALYFYLRSIIEKGFSGNSKVIFKRNILVRKGNKQHYKFIINPNLNEQNESARLITESFRLKIKRILFLTLIKNKDCNYARNAELALTNIYWFYGN